MINHARMLLVRGWSVALAGLRETELPADLAMHPRVTVLAVTVELTANRGTRRRARWALLRLIARQRPEAWSLVVVQNPPAFPVLMALAWAAHRCHGRGMGLRPRVIVDWHNLGHTLLTHAGKSRVTVAVYRWFERRWTRRADAHWAVSSAMATHVRDWLGVAAVTVLPDQPPAWLCRAAQVSDDRQAWWQRVLPTVAPPAADAVWLVMPSSWTVDENTDLLHEAVKIIAEANEQTGWPEGARRIAVIATGRGPGLADFLAKFPGDGHVSVHAVWLTAADYAALLGHADAGLCLHTSSSGLDLPMKLADMRGAGLPALVYDYGAVLRETFIPGTHGLLFKSARELAECLVRLAGEPSLRRVTMTGPTWEENWARADEALRQLFDR